MGSFRNVGFIGLLLIGFISAEVSAQQRLKCPLFFYYDIHMDNCAPCREICEHMEITRTQEQCQAECTDYLTAASCSYEQYYDEMVRNCAPCTEICTHHVIKRTTDECSQKCYKYLKSLNCTEDEYFNDHDLSCSACSLLCSRRDEEDGTPEECFQKCPKYVEKNPPGNIIDDPNRSPAVGSPAKVTDKASSSKTSTHPGIIVTILIGVVVIGVTVAVVVYWVRSRRPRYAAAPADDTRVETVVQVDVLGTGEREASAPSVNREGGEGGNSQQPVRYGIEECDPLASSWPSYINRESVV